MKKIAIRAFALLKIAHIQIEKIALWLISNTLRVITEKQNHNLDNHYAGAFLLPNDEALELGRQGKCCHQRAPPPTQGDCSFISITVHRCTQRSQTTAQMCYLGDRNWTWCHGTHCINTSYRIYLLEYKEHCLKTNFISEFSSFKCANVLNGSLS